MSTTDPLRPAHTRARLPLFLALLLPCTIVAALACGAVALSPAEVWQGVTGQDQGQAAMIVLHLRLPRTLLAALTGAVLAVSGAAMQGLFRNPLADPSLIGVTAGASLGASLAIVFSGTVACSAAGCAPLQGGLLGLSLTSAGAFCGGILAVLLVYRLATGVGDTGATDTSVATMLLAGIAITAMAGALGSLLEFFADNEVLRRISLWKMGGLDGADYRRVAVAAAVGAALLAALPAYAVPLNALLLGESEARHLGIPVDRVKLALVFWVALGVGTSVALAGTIAFVGLVVPHLVRLVTGPDHRVVLPAAALAGASLLVAADTLARVVMAPVELPVGIVTALLGVPFFLSLLRGRAAGLPT